jgi:hypothetical protein
VEEATYTDACSAWEAVQDAGQEGEHPTLPDIPSLINRLKVTVVRSLAGDRLKVLAEDLIDGGNSVLCPGSDYPYRNRL